MRVTKDAAARNREAILEAAMRLFKTRGCDSVSVADLMNAAGFTHGGFYNHFRSKADLTVEVIRRAFDRSLAGLEADGSSDGQPPPSFLRAVDEYLSPAHRDEDAGGCPTGSLPVDVARQPAEAQAAFADGLERYLTLLGHALPREAATREGAIATLSTLVGAIVLARAVRYGRPELSDEILDAARGDGRAYAKRPAEAQ